MMQSHEDSGVKSPGKLPSGRHGLPRNVVIQSQRERMVEAMIEAVAEKGFVGTTVADIIATAGVSRATFYEQFADKEDCFVAAYATVMDRLLAFVSEGFATDDSGDWIERVRGGIRSLLRYLTQNPVAVRVGIIEGFGAGARARDRYQQAVSAFFPFLDAARQKIKNPERVPAQTSRVIVGGISALIFNEALAGNGKDLPQLLPQMMFLAVVPFMGYEAAMEAMLATEVHE
ncbi:MAG: TetR/AcrR family transcriptional regulator [Solirubrobacterales bacterium]